MKRIVCCLLVLISAIATSTSSTCAFKTAVHTGDVVELVGTFGGVPAPCDDPNHEHCPECYVLGIVYGGNIYLINEEETNWTAYIRANFIVMNDQVEVTGVLSEDEEYHYIDMISIKRIPQCVENISGAAVLDPEQPMYNMLGVPVDVDYKGVIIQDGHKFVR